MYSTIDDRILPAGEVRYSEIDVVELTQRGNLLAGNQRIADHTLHAILSDGRPRMEEIDSQIRGIAFY